MTGNVYKSKLKKITNNNYGSEPKYMYSNCNTIIKYCN